MEKDSLAKFIEETRQIWGPVNSKLVVKSQALLEELADASKTEPWLAALQGEITEGRELYRDPEHGFLLLAHTENEGIYRVPHDHGMGWVIYAVQRGEVEMGTYANIKGENGQFNLVRREFYRVKQGQTRVFLPGDIHDTKSISNSVLMFRLTSRDLTEEQRFGRMVAVALLAMV